MTNGSDLIVATALANGIDHCFANPGTTELHLVEALDKAAGMRSVLCAFEGVASGAADAFARITGRPALGLFHLGPGFANSLANQHNARRHHTPMINLIGDQATWHLDADAPLTSDIDLLTTWSGEGFHVGSADDAAATLAEAIAFALHGDQRIASVIVPADHAWTDTTAEPVIAPVPADTEPDPSLIAGAAVALRRSGAVLLLDGPRIDAACLASARAITEATGCRAFTNRPAQIEVGRTRPRVSELPYFPAPLAAALAEATVAVVTGASEPVTFFGYPGVGSRPLPDTAERYVLGADGASLESVLSALCSELGVEPAAGPGREVSPLPSVAPGTLGIENLGQAFTRAIPEHGIVIGEGLTSSAGYTSLAASAAPHTRLGVTGGAIGGGLPAAIGAAVAAPDRPVLALQADGSSLYTIQSLWTMAREALDITVVICANRAYNILDVELQQAAIQLSDSSASLTSLANPAIDFAGVAQGFGVPGVSVSTGAELERELARAAAEPGPHLIEAVLAG